MSPHFQPKLLLVQLEDIPSSSVTSYLLEEANPQLPTPSFQVAVESNEVSTEPSFLQTKQPQFPQPLLTGLVLQALHQLCSPALDHYISAGPAGPGKVLTLSSECCALQSSAKGKPPLASAPVRAGSTGPGLTAQEAAARWVLTLLLQGVSSVFLTLPLPD